MTKYTSHEMLIAGQNAVYVAEKNMHKSNIYKYYMEKFKDIITRFNNSINEISSYEENWLNEKKINIKRKNKAEKLYKKYSRFIQKDLNCMSLALWKNTKIPADELIHALEDITDILESCPELIYSEEGRRETKKILEELDAEVKETSEAHDMWRIKVVAKNKIQDELRHALTRFRQYVRNDIGYDSTDYEKLRDKSIRKE